MTDFPHDQDGIDDPLYAAAKEARRMMDQSAADRARERITGNRKPIISSNTDEQGFRL